MYQDVTGSNHPHKTFGHQKRPHPFPGWWEDRKTKNLTTENSVKTNSWAHCPTQCKETQGRRGRPRPPCWTSAKVGVHPRAILWVSLVVRFLDNIMIRLPATPPLLKNAVTWFLTPSNST